VTVTTEPGLHPTAVIDAKATLGSGVRIGAYSVIGPEVVLGPEADVGHHVVLEGRVDVGARARIGHGTVIGGVPQDLKYRDGTPSGVRIGEGTIIREYVTIHRSSRPDTDTEIGPECLLMASCHVAHDCRLGRGVIVINYAGLTGHCEVHDRATIGGLTGIAPFTRVGTHAYIGGVSKITADVPPFMLVDGRPAVARGINVIGLRRAGLAPPERRALQDAYRLLYRSGLTVPRALEQIRETLPASTTLAVLLDFVGAAKRIVAGPVRGEVESAVEGEDEQIF
jgi:UDP-N-acetylglucosamine acyltransferase